ncbi:CpsD/CapB family tyrosine-protein kinase [Desulfococcaceae bacterium HSG9]|nr:CpsD/CapB family tyrosine-protein kinase [Desulfococcaceae bacterium HSG9]
MKNRKDESVIESSRDNGGNNLGNILGLVSPSQNQPKATESLHEKEKLATKSDSGDLASVIGLGASIKMDNQDSDYHAINHQKTETDTSKGYTNKSKKKSAKPHHYKKGEPFLWLLYPELYPHVVEVFRYLKTKISASESKRNKKLKTLLITGPDENCGVSTVAFNLALALSFDMIDKRILLVDTNISAPSLHTAFGYPVNPGLIDYLFGIRPLDDIILPSDYPNLHLIPSGSIDYLAVVPFDLTEFSYFLNDVREQYDFVLLDSAPLLKSSKTQSLSSQTDGVIIVAEANRTRWQVMADLKNQLDNNGANLVGSFLNKRRFPIPKWLYRWI